MLNGISLFSGIGGIDLALSEWVRTICYCENDRYAQAVLLSRMHDGSLHRAPIWDDVCTFETKPFEEMVDIIFGGFPCQDISVAGLGAGLGGSRSGLFFEIVRLTRELRPRFIFLENVPAITVRGLDRVLLEITALGYDCRWTIVSAAEMGAPHIRERWFLLAHANGECSGDERKTMGRTRTGMGEWNSKSFNASKCWDFARASNGFPASRICRVDDGLSARMDRHHALGNAVVPIQAREAFVRLCGLK